MASCFVMLAAACSDDDDTRSSIDSTTRAVTYWEDMVPLFEAHCLQCHREGGIAPLRLDQYASAKGKAEQIRRHTASRTMPPWGVTSDGSCGEFSDSLALSAEQIAKIDQWVAAGAQEGVARALSVPPLPTLEAGKELKTPLFVPEVEGASSPSPTSTAASTSAGAIQRRRSSPATRCCRARPRSCTTPC